MYRFKADYQPFTKIGDRLVHHFGTFGQQVLCLGSLHQPLRACSTLSMISEAGAWPALPKVQTST